MAIRRLSRRRKISHKWNGNLRVAQVPACPLLLGKRTYKPNSVVCGHSSRRRVTADAHQRPTRRFRRLHEPPERTGPVRNAILALDRRFPPYLVLLRVGFTMPAALPSQRCALTAPFHPYSPRRAVCFLWHWPSVSLNAHIPDVIRHTALRSSDFPPPEPRVSAQLRQRPPGPPAISSLTRIGP